MSARTNSRFCPLCTIEIKESRLVPQHVYIEHAHSGTKPLSVEEIKVLSVSSYKSFLCNCSLLPPLDDIPGFHRVAWEDIVKHTEQRHLAGIRDRPASVPRERKASDRKYAAGVGVGPRAPMLAGAHAAAARLPPSDAQMKALVKELISGGVMLDDVPFDCRVHFNVLVHKLAEPALVAKTSGDFPGYEEAVTNFIVQIRRSLVSARGGRRGRVTNTINERLIHMIHEPDELEFRVDAEAEAKADAKEVKEVLDGKDEKREEPGPPREPGLTPQQANRASLYLSHGLPGKSVRVVAQTGSLPEITPAIIAEMSRKILQCPPLDIPRPPADAPQRTFTHGDAALFQYIARTSSCGSAPGPSQLSYRHIQRIAATDIGRKLVASILTDLHNGSFSESMKHLFLSSTCTPVPKKDGTHRPVIAGDTFRRIVASSIVHSNRESLREAAGDFQFGCGLPNGASSLAHLLQLLLDSGLACVEADVVNAFPSRDRRSIVNKVNSDRRLAAFQLFTNYCYSSQSTVYLAQRGQIVATLRSCNGVEQGDPEGSPLFCVDFADDIREAQLAHPAVLFLVFVDNVFILGQPNDLPAAYDTLRNISAKKGSMFSPSPKFVYWNSSAAPLTESLTDWIEERGYRLELGAVKILGAPLGPSRNLEATSELALKIIQRNDMFLSRLCSPLLTSQTALALLRISGEGRAVYLSRCARPSIAAAALKHHDHLKYEVVRSRGFIMPDEWTRKLQRLIGLPLRLGGMGIRSAFDTADYAWFAALAAAAPFITKALVKFFISDHLNPGSPLFIETQAALAHIHSSCSADVQGFLPAQVSEVLSYYADAQRLADQPKFQRALTKSAEQSFADNISNHGDDRTAGLMKARTEHLAYLWKDTVPLSPDLFLSDEQVSFNLRTEYGLQPVPDGVCVGRCGMCHEVTLAHDNTHFINCKLNAGLRIRRHNDCLRILAEGLRELHCPVTIEPRKLSNKDRSRPDIDTWLGFKRILLDFTNRNDASLSQINHDIMSAAEADKSDHYRPMAAGIRAEFKPFVTNSFGGLANGALDFVRSMRRFGLSRSPLSSPVDVTRLMCRRLAIAIHRANYDMYEEGVAKSFVPIPEA